MKRSVKKSFELIASCCFFMSLLNSMSAQPYTAVINTSVVSPINPNIENVFANTSNGISVLVRNADKIADTFKIVGRLERLAPTPFTITVNSTGFSDIMPILFNQMQTRFLTNDQLNNAFNKFIAGTLTVVGLKYPDGVEDIKEAGRVKLPPGQYRVCFSAQYPFSQVPNSMYKSNPNLGCAIFTICKLDPPQFTQPVSNLAINSNFTLIQSHSPVNFTWTPPLASCGSPGLVDYELEIHEILVNQNVTDAINNPFVFRKTAIPSPAFLLDLNLYQNALQPGKKYAIRVKARVINTNSTAVIENNGYSRIEAFQFGPENANTPNPFWNAQSYFIPLAERKSNFWDDYETRRGRDTLVPIEEYIAYKLMQDGVAYNLDAIELLLSLNPELKDQQMVKLYQPLNLPVFPEVAANQRRDFEQAHANNLKPNNEEVILFKKYLDSLKNINRRKVPERFIPDLNDLTAHLDQFRSQVSLLNSVSLSFINSMLSELIFELRKSTGNFGNTEYNHLRNIASDLKALSVIPPSSASLIPTEFFGTDLSFKFSKMTAPGMYTLLASFSYYGKQIIKDKQAEGIYAVGDQLIPLEVVVYRPSPTPAKPIFEAPDLKKAYRIFYTTRELYNNRNPAINAKSPGPLASTTQVSLPRSVEYKFWTLNMLNHKSTLAQDIDIDELFLNSQKKDLKGKKLRVVLKVE